MFWIGETEIATEAFEKQSLLYVFLSKICVIRLAKNCDLIRLQGKDFYVPV